MRNMVLLFAVVLLFSGCNPPNPPTQTSSPATAAPAESIAAEGVPGPEPNTRITEAYATTRSPRCLLLGVAYGEYVQPAACICAGSNARADWSDSTACSAQSFIDANGLRGAGGT
jgi:hypothetical protein